MRLHLSMSFTNVLLMTAWVFSKIKRIHFKPGYLTVPDDNKIMCFNDIKRCDVCLLIHSNLVGLLIFFYWRNEKWDYQRFGRSCVDSLAYYHSAQVIHIIHTDMLPNWLAALFLSIPSHNEKVRIVCWPYVTDSARGYTYATWGGTVNDEIKKRTTVEAPSCFIPPRHLGLARWPAPPVGYSDTEEIWVNCHTYGDKDDFGVFFSSHQ